jgi:hypothetical protein
MDKWYGKLYNVNEKGVVVVSQYRQKPVKKESKKEKEGKKGWKVSTEGESIPFSPPYLSPLGKWSKARHPCRN